MTTDTSASNSMIVTVSDRWLTPTSYVQREDHMPLSGPAGDRLGVGGGPHILGLRPDRDAGTAVVSDPDCEIGSGMGIDAVALETLVVPCGQAIDDR